MQKCASKTLLMPGSEFSHYTLGTFPLSVYVVFSLKRWTSVDDVFHLNAMCLMYRMLFVRLGQEGATGRYIRSRVLLDLWHDIDLRLSKLGVRYLI